MLSRIDFPFIWKKHFVPETNSEDCVPACIAMTALYWKSKFPKLSLPTKLDEWKSYFDELNVHSPRGTNLAMLKSALSRLKKDSIGLSLQMFNPKNLADLTKLFDVNIPIPIILCYDRSMVINNFEGPNHASLFHKIDTWRDQVQVIDPSLVHRKTPMTYLTSDFKRGWKQLQHLTIIAYPSNMRVPINMNDNEPIQPLDTYGDK